MPRVCSCLFDSTDLQSLEGPSEMLIGLIDSTDNIWKLDLRLSMYFPDP